MTALRLLPAHPLARTWRQFITEIGDLQREDHDPWRYYPIGDSRPAATAVPALRGFTVYAVPAGPNWLYVGQTRQVLRRRVDQHLQSAEKLSTWPGVMALALDEKATGFDVDRIERLGCEILRPLNGRRWPRS